MHISRVAALVAAALTVPSLTFAHIGHGVPGHVDVSRRAEHEQQEQRHLALKRAVQEHEHSHHHNHFRHHRRSSKSSKKHSKSSSSSSSSSADAGNPQGTTEASAALVKSQKKQCTPYGLTEVTAMSKDFPVAWDVASILPNDQRALQIMQQINASGLIPKDIQPRGTQPASLTGTGTETGYDSKTDSACYWTATGCTTPKNPGLLPDISSCSEPHSWGYTLDDGPNCTHNALYDFWKTNNQKASLFYIGSNVLDWPLEAQRGLVDGHHICVHTWSHRYMTSLTTDQAFAELYYTLLAIRRIMGITVTCWRPPFGDVDDRIRAIAQSLGLRTYIWDGDTNDWEVEPYGTQPTATVLANYASLISKGSSPAAETGGVIVLEHELNNATMELLVEEYPKIKQAWPNLVPLTACLNVTKPYVEGITYPNFAEYVAGSIEPQGAPSGTIVIDATALVTPQGTLSGMGGLMQTAPAGGPDNANAGSNKAVKQSSSALRIAPLSPFNAISSTLFTLALAGFASGALLLMGRCA